MINVVTLSDVCEFIDHKRKPITAKDRVSGQYPYYGANGVQDYVDGYLFDDELVLLAEDGGHFDDPSRGVAYRVSGKCWVNNHAHVLKPKSNINVDYLGYVLKQYDVRPYITGAIVKKLNQKDARKITFPLPNLDEQKVIVQMFDKADSLRQKRKRSLNMLDEYINSVFLEMFENEKTDWLALKEISNFIDYRGKTPVKTEQGINLITAKNVKEGYLDFQPEEFIAEDNYLNWMRRGFPNEGDVLFTTEAPLGNTAILPKFDKLAFAQRIIVIQPKEMIKSEFLLFALNSTLVRDDILRRSTGSTVKGIRSKELAKVKIPIPELNKQEIFVSVFNSKTKLKQKMLDQSKELETQFQSLLQRSFH